MSQRPSAGSYLPVGLILLLFAWTGVVTAWLSDDSFISFRQILNAVDGHGLTWNYGQRVQAFTHPAWVMLLTVLVALTREIYVTTIVVSLVLSLSSVVWLVTYVRALPERSSRPVFAYALIGILAFSKAFTDYMTSGLENPLSFALVGLAIWQGRQLANGDRAGWGPTVIFGALALAVLNRLDHVLLLAPIAAYVWVQMPRRQAVRAALPGALILVAWLIFSVVYFGAPLPNTYLAKLVSGLPLDELRARGAAYFSLAFSHDPVTAALIAIGVVSGFVSASWLTRSVSLGILLYAGYVFNIGGDFMEGRFLAILAYASLFNLLSLDERRPGLLALKSGALAVAIAAVAVGPKPPLSDREYRHLEFVDGIADERGVWYERYGLLSPRRDWPAIGARPERKPDEYRVTCVGADGLMRRDVLWIDICGLSDAFLARLPAIRSRGWRVGHAYRKVPTDYGDVMIGRMAALGDPGLQELFDDVQLVVLGPLLSLDRARAIVKLNGGAAYGFDRERYADPDVVVPWTSRVTDVDYDQFNHEPRDDGAVWLVPVLEGVVWPQSDVATSLWVALSMAVQEPTPARSISLSVDGNDTYRLIVNGGEFEASIDASAGAGAFDGLVNHHVALPREILVSHVRIEPVSGDGYYAVGHVRLEPAGRPN